MQRWNGWGDMSVDYPMPEGTASFLIEALGEGVREKDASMETVLEGLPPSRLDTGDGISTDPVERLLHAHGQSLPDWIALRSGRIGRAPDGVAFPENPEQVRASLRQSAKSGTRVIPYGGGTSVVGHINPIEGDDPVLTLDLCRMNRLLGLDETGMIARFEAGVTGPAIERQLSEHGYTLGHFPQSWEFSTLGGWIATRSTGQQSYHYGRIEDLFTGGSLETPVGTLPMPSLPASAAGPDLRQIVLGSEGRLGVITEAMVRIRPIPQQEAFYGIFFREWEGGFEATRALAQERIPVSMVRLSDAQETITTLALAGKPRLIRAGDFFLRALGAGEGRCLMILGITSDRVVFSQTKGVTLEILRAHGGIATGTLVGKQWRKSRFRSPHLRNTLWEQGYALDTLETAVPWSGLAAAREAIMQSLDRAFRMHSVPLLQFSHISHVYPDGASIYITFLYPRQNDPDNTLAVWQAAKRAASEEIVAHQGTISHQHGIGLDHLPYLEAEKHMLGVQTLQAISQTFDPQGMMNPGKGWPSGKTN